MEQHSRRHWTSISRFLRSEEWDDSELEAAVKKLVIEIIYGESERSGKPVYCIIDDAIASKSMPTAKAKPPSNRRNSIIHSCHAMGSHCLMG